MSPGVVQLAMKIAAVIRFVARDVTNDANQEENDMRSMIIAAAIAVATSGVALAGSGSSNSDAAKAMASVLSGTPGIASVAPTVSGTNASGPGDSGWGNAGSRLVVSKQVSRGK